VQTLTHRRQPISVVYGGAHLFRADTAPRLGATAQRVLREYASEVFDDAATGQGLLTFFLKALNCGAVGESEIGSLTGLSLEELRSGSFVKIVQSSAFARSASATTVALAKVVTAGARWPRRTSR
jgi:hypothetical protein